MVTSQQFVLGWFEYAAAGTALLLVTKLIVSRLRQPIDRQNLILMGLVASAFLPLVVSFSSVPNWHLGLVAIDKDQVAVAQVASTTKQFHPEQFSALAATEPNTANFFQDQFAANRIADQQREQRPNAEQVRLTADLPATSASGLSHASSSFTSNSTETTSAIPFSVWWIAAAILILSHVMAFGFFMIEKLVGTIRLRNICRAAHSPDASVKETWTQFSGERGASVRLLLSTQITAPMVFGCWRPVILIPKSLAQGDRSALRFCLAHEWSHIIGGDLRAWQFANFCQFLLWYQPLFWMLRRELRICQDLIADDRAVGTSSEVENRLQYSELLMSISKQKLNPNIVGAIAFHDRSSQLSRRIKMLLSSSQSLRVRSPQAFLWLSGCLLLAASLMVGSVRLNTANAEAGLTEQPEIAQDGDTKQATDDQKQSEQLVEDVSDGVRLLGRGNRTQQLLGQRLHVSPDGKRLATTYYGREVVIIDREQAKVVQSITFDVGQRLPVVQDVLFSPSGKYWVVALTVFDPADLEFGDGKLPDDSPDHWNIERGNYLVIYADGQLIERPIRVGEPTGFARPLPSVLFSPHERWLVWERNGVVQPFDLQKRQALTKQEDWGGCFFTADDVLTSWTARQSRNLGTEQISDWQPPASVQGATFDSVGPDGRTIVLSAENGVVFLNLDTQSTTSFTDLRDTRPDYVRVGQPQFDGKLSTGGKYFAGRGTAPFSQLSLFFVYDVQNQRFALKPTALVLGVCFMGAEEKVWLKLAADAAWHEIELGPESHKQIVSLADRYPASSWIQFADQNRHLVIGDSHRWINRKTGKTLGRGLGDATGVLERYPSPWDMSSFEFAQAQVANYVVRRRQVTTGHSRQLYAHNSTSNAAALLGHLLGGPIESHGVFGLHLACAPDKKLLWELRHESRLGFIFRQWDVERQKLDWEKTFKVRTPFVDVMRTADISPDGTRFAVTTNEQLWVVDAAEGQVVAEIKLPKIPSIVTLNHNGSLVAISFRSDMAGVERVLLLDVASKTFVHTLAGGRFLEPKFHPAQDFMAVVKTGTANQLTIFDTTTWEEVYKHETSTAPALAMAISDDFRSLAMTLSDTRIEVWDLAKLGYTNVKSP